MTPIHAEMAAGRWETLSLFEQMGNIGGEVGRVRRWQGRDPGRANGAVDRALELMDLTLRDPRWRHRRKEIARVREIFCDVLFGSGSYRTTLPDLERYFNTYALTARSSR
ncbi:hypothetical protein HY522_00230 [bacterium]|nr:hypothetical protein [bacterium]